MTMAMQNEMVMKEHEGPRGRAGGRVAPEAPTPPAPFEKPSPGSWNLDASHCERPLPRFMCGLFEDVFTRGNRDGAKVYGALLDTVEASLVNGFIYTCVRPYGAPPEPKGSPPKLLFKLLLWLHPGVRRRLRDCDAAFEQQLWRAETAHYLEETAPPLEACLGRLLAVDVGSLSDAALIDHVAACRALITDDLYAHYRLNITRILPVGDLLAHVQAWAGIGATEVLAALRGSSPSSVDGLSELVALAELARGDEALVASLRSPSLRAEVLLDELEGRDDPIGAAARAWIAAVGHRATGFSPGYPTLRETPSTLITALRGAIDSTREDDDAVTAGRAARASLRERIPEAERERFDLLFAEAERVHFIRDHATMRATAIMGVARVALLELGRRLVARERLEEPEAALDLLHDEIASALDAEPAADFDAARVWHAWRRRATAEHAPELLGPPEGAPPPLEWLPPGARRFSSAIDAYVDAMFGEVEPEPQAEGACVVQGRAASPGKAVGIARLVLEPGDFDRVQEGDVLIARMTTPSYNVLLPLLAGVVTDRGGTLSHPAIVSREYGIPGVVGTRVATATIPDGARVEIDGDAGTVRVLS